MHDGTCNNCNGGLSPQNSILVMTGLAMASAVAITALRPHEDNTALITLVIGLLTPTIAQLVGINKTQEVHKALCEAAVASNIKKEEIRQLVEKDLTTTVEVKQQLQDAKVSLRDSAIKQDATSAATKEALGVTLRQTESDTENIKQSLQELKDSQCKL